MEVAYGYNERGNIEVPLREMTGNSEAQVEIAWSHGLDDQQIDSMSTLSQSYRVE